MPIHVSYRVAVGKNIVGVIEGAAVVNLTRSQLRCYPLRHCFACLKTPPKQKYSPLINRCVSNHALMYGQAGVLLDTPSAYRGI